MFPYRYENKGWTRRPDMAARLIVLQCSHILEMRNKGLITEADASGMYEKVFQLDRIAPEVAQVVHRGGVLPLTGQTSRLIMFNWFRARPTEKPPRV